MRLTLLSTTRNPAEEGTYEPGRLHYHMFLRESSYNLGLVSLMALELKQRLENGLDIVLPIESLMKDPSLAELSAMLLALMETSSLQAR